MKFEMLKILAASVIALSALISTADAHTRRAGPILGLSALTAAAIMTADALSYPSYFHHRVSRSGPKRWSRSWYIYCAKKYKSFNARTGRYTSRSGRQRICR